MTFNWAVLAPAHSKTDCGCTHQTETGLKDALKAEHPQLEKEISGFQFGTYDGSSLEK